MRNIKLIFYREFSSYFATPLAYVFITMFLSLSGAFTFYIGNFFERGQASLEAFFVYHPWLYLPLIPAVTMRLWAEERKSGTIELLMTLPISATEAVLGKFCAAWIFIAVTLALTFPVWITVNILGDPDNGVIVAGYLGSWLMAGAFLSIGTCLSALTKNQVIAFILAILVCFLFTMSGLDIVLDPFRNWAPHWLVETIASMSFLTHFSLIVRGVIDLRDIVFFASLIVFWLFINVTIVNLRKAL